MCPMCLESQCRGVRMAAVSAPCQTWPRQKLDAKFKQGSKLNFNKPLTSFLLPHPERHNAWLDRQEYGVILQNVATLKYFKDIILRSCFRMSSSELDAWPRAIVKLIWLSGVTNKPESYKSVNTEHGAVVGMSCRHESLSCHELLSEDCHDATARSETPLWCLAWLGSHYKCRSVKIL